MRLVLFLGFVLAGCVSVNGEPAQVGMTLSQYASSCPYGDPSIYDEPGFTSGVCPTKPGEYTLIEGGKVVAVMGPDEMGRFLASKRCDENNAECLKVQISRMRDHESNQRFRLDAAINQENRNRGIALQRFGAGLSSAGASPTNSSGELCTSAGEHAEGFSKICVYSCPTGPAAITVDSVAICPLTIENPR